MYISKESNLRFEWDPAKARRNAKKHGVSFQEAETVFLDEERLLIEDPAPSRGEARFILLGASTLFRLLAVAHCLRGDEATIRIVSARKATRSEAREYQERLHK